MVHHDARDYNVAVSEAAKQGRAKMEKIIQDGMKSAESVIETVAARIITDRVVKADRVKVELVEAEKGPSRFALALPDGSTANLHPNAIGQMFADAGMPKTFADKLVAQANGRPWGAELVRHNLNEIYGHRHQQRNLVRAEGDTAKAWLSDKFRRLDSRPLLESFVGACQTLGLVPIQGVGSDTKIRLRAVVPQVFEPVPNEVMLFGAEWANSDFGDGSNTVNLWCMRVWCTNLAITETFLRQVHLGKRLDDRIEYSDRTYKLDTQATAAALADTVRAAIGPKTINAVVENIRSMTETELKGRDSVERKLGALSKTDKERVIEAFEGPDVVNLPAGQTTWRLSNAISWIAQHKDNSADRRIELEAAAGAMIPGTKAKAVEV